MNTARTHLKQFITRIGFFQAMAMLLLFLTLVGFAPTFFLRPWFHSTPLPFRLHVHGVFTTLWILVFFTQTILVARGDVAIHRRMGVFATTVAGGLVVSGLAILYSLAAGYPDNGWQLTAASSVVWGNIASLTLFSTFVGAGVALRARAQTHKRMMLYATLAIMGPPLARIGGFEIFRISDALVVNDAIYVLGGYLFLYALILMHDLIRMRRPHPTLLWVVPLHFGLIFAAGLGMAGTDLGQGLILALSGSGAKP